jgi:UDP-3-O-[3-hydroxymyristoyl] glucosamine N-acyltransferase
MQIIKLQQIADLVKAEIYGNPETEITAVAKINEAQEGELTYLYLDKYAKYLSETKASAVIVGDKFPRDRDDITYLVHPNPHLAFVQVLTAFFDYHPDLVQNENISSSAAISSKAKIGRNVVIGENVKIGKGTVISHNCVILEDSEIGENCTIYPNVTIREKTKIGNRVIIHPGTVIGSDGFGFIPDETGVYHKIPQVGNVVIEDDVELGANVSIDRAALGSTIIRKGVKIDNLVQIAHNVEIGENSVMSGQSGISGSSKIGKNVIIAGQVGVAGHLEVGDRVIIAAQSGVSKSILTPGMYFGTPTKEIKLSHRLEAHHRNLPKYAERIKSLEKQVAELSAKINEKQ